MLPAEAARSTLVGPSNACHHELSSCNAQESCKGPLLQRAVDDVIYVARVQMVGRLLGQSSTATADRDVPSVSPGDIGIICFHRAQVSLFTVQADRLNHPAHNLKE